MNPKAPALNTSLGPAFAIHVRHRSSNRQLGQQVARACRALAERTRARAATIIEETPTVIVCYFVERMRLPVIRQVIKMQICHSSTARSAQFIWHVHSLIALSYAQNKIVLVTSFTMCWDQLVTRSSPDWSNVSLISLGRWHRCPVHTLSSYRDLAFAQYCLQHYCIL